MNIKISTVFAVFLSAASAIGFSGCDSAVGMTDRQAFVIYDAGGSAVSYDKMLDDISKYDVVLFGELHNDPISHWLELGISEDLHEIHGDRLVIGAEMWESDNQLTLDEFVLDSLIDMDTYVENSRLWQNFDTDYKPVLQFAAENGIPFIATNVPRKYANMVSKRGFAVLDSLREEAYRYIAPLPVKVDYDQEIYRSITEMFKNAGGMPAKKGDVRNLVDAQALKDATMAHFIVENREKDEVFFHFHGEFHSAYHSAIAYYIKEYAPGTKIVTISVTEAENPSRMKIEKGRADYTVAVPVAMTKTYAE